jgi:uroporphyrinogen decarboxylase
VTLVEPVNGQPVHGDVTRAEPRRDRPVPDGGVPDGGVPDGPVPEGAHRRRVASSLAHRQADRVPLTMGGPSCSLHRDAHRNLLGALGITPERDAPIVDRILQIVEPDPQLLRRLDVDLLWLLPHEPEVEWSTDGRSYTDGFGRSFVEGGGFFNQATHPLREGTGAELAAYRFPELSPALVVGLGEKARRLHAEGYGLGVDGPWGIYETASSLRGTEDYLMDLALDPAYARALAERVLEEHHLPFYTRLLEEAGPHVQVVGISDDLGSQQGLIFSPETFRSVFKPLLRRLVDHIRGLADVRVYMHSDGAISDLIPDLIDAGVEGLNPVQYTARGMELERLKREFGADLGFFGGTLDNEILSFGTPDAIRREVRANVATLAPGGGFVFASIHNIAPEVPPENVVALFEAALEFGAYE